MNRLYLSIYLLGYQRLAKLTEPSKNHLHYFLGNDLQKQVFHLPPLACPKYSWRRFVCFIKNFSDDAPAAFSKANHPYHLKALLNVYLNLATFKWSSFPLIWTLAVCTTVCPLPPSWNLPHTWTLLSCLSLAFSPQTKQSQFFHLPSQVTVSKPLMIFTAGITPWMSSSWLLTVLCPKLDAEPCPALSGADGLFCAFSRNSKPVLFLKGQGRRNFVPSMTVRHPQSRTYDPLRSEMCCPAHTEREMMSWAWQQSCRVASSRVGAQAGRGGKEKPPAQQSAGSPAPQGQESRMCCRLLFSGSMGSNCDFF